MRINTNISAMQANSSMAKNSALAGNSMEKLSTGLAINKAGDNAAGLAISEKMRAQIRGMEQADKNVQDGISLVQTAEGALAEAGDIVQRMRELGVQAGNSTLNDADRANIEAEVNQLGEELMKISHETKFNDKQIFGAGVDFTIQAGANNETRTIKGIDLKELLTEEIQTGKKDSTGTEITGSFLGTDADIDADSGEVTKVEISLADETEAQKFVAITNSVLEEITTARATLGAQQNRLEATSSNLGTSIENLTSAESRIRDTDVAKEIVKLSKLNLLTQTSQSMVAQAKSQPENIMSLLR